MVIIIARSLARSVLTEKCMADWNSLLSSVNATALRAFGREIVYAPKVGSEFTLRAILEAPREPDDSSPGLYAVAFVRTADLVVQPLRGDTLVVDGRRYQVFDIEADDGGGLLLRLRQS